MFKELREKMKWSNRKISAGKQHSAGTNLLYFTTVKKILALSESMRIKDGYSLILRRTNKKCLKVAKILAEDLRSTYLKQKKIVVEK